MASSHSEEAGLVWTVVFAKVFLGGLYIWAGLAKLMDLNAFVESVGNFEIYPFNTEPLDVLLGYTLPAFEVIVGSCLILGFVYRGALISALSMSVAFLAAIISVHLRGLNIECGCFGKALTFDNYYTHMAVLALLVISALYLIWAEFKKS